MRVVVAGGHGKIGMRLLQLLAEHGHDPVGIIRKPDQAADLRSIGAEPLILDLEAVDEVELDGDAVVFAAGAGAGSGAQRKWTMDYGGAAKLMKAGIDRYVMVSAMGAGNPPAEGEGDVFGTYLRAKARADQELMASGLAYTIVRPGLLTDDPGTGRVRAAEQLPRGEIPRDDVAAVLDAVIEDALCVGRVFDLVSGEDEIGAALSRLA